MNFPGKRVLSVFKYSNYLLKTCFWQKCQTDRWTDEQTDRQWWFYRTLCRMGIQNRSMNEFNLFLVHPISLRLKASNYYSFQYFKPKYMHDTCIKFMLMLDIDLIQSVTFLKLAFPEYILNLTLSIYLENNNSLNPFLLLNNHNLRICC